MIELTPEEKERLKKFAEIPPPPPPPNFERHKLQRAVSAENDDKRWRKNSKRSQTPPAPIGNRNFRPIDAAPKTAPKSDVEVSKVIRLTSIRLPQNKNQNEANLSPIGDSQVSSSFGSWDSKHPSGSHGISKRPSGKVYSSKSKVPVSNGKFHPAGGSEVKFYLLNILFTSKNRWTLDLRHKNFGLYNGSVLN